VGVAGSTAGAEEAVVGSIVGAEAAGLTAGAVVAAAGSTAGAAEVGGLIAGRRFDSNLFGECRGRMPTIGRCSNLPALPVFLSSHR
jgi:hypothetical protein